MINKIAESHFNALLATPDLTVQSKAPAKESTTHNALDSFLSTPSFSSKQIAIESLLRQITQGTTPSKAGTLG